jgi:hypothetical protein
MTDLEHRIIAVLDRIASEAGTPPANLTDTVIAQGRRVKHRRAVAGSVLAVICIAVAVPVAIAFTHRTDSVSRIAGNSTSQWTQRLPQGAAPAVLYATSGGQPTLVDGSLHVPLPAKRAGAPIARVGSDYLVFLSPRDRSHDNPSDLVLVTPQGRQRRLAHGDLIGAAVSPDGTRVAWARLSKSGGDTEIVIAEVSTGKQLATTLIRNYVVGVYGYIDSGLVLRYTPAGEHVLDERVFLWAGRSAAAPVLLRNHVAVVAVSADRQHAVVQAGPVLDCARVMDLPTGTIHDLPGCQRPSSIAPAGDYVVITDYVGGHDRATVVRVANGSKIALQVEPGQALGNRGVWEDGTHWIVNVDANDATGKPVHYLVRCDVTTGACERAAGPFTTWPQLGNE